MSKHVPAVLALDFGPKVGPDTRPAVSRVLPDTRVGYPAPNTAGTLPKTLTFFFKSSFFKYYLYILDDFFKILLAECNSVT